MRSGRHLPARVISGGRDRRVVLSVILGSLIAAPAHAAPLLFTFSGVIPLVEGLTEVNTVSNGQSSTVFTQTLLFGVPFSGSMTFDSDVWALVGAPDPLSPFLRQFTVIDPANPGAPSLGVDTPELISGTIDVGGGVGTLPFNRHLVDEVPSTASPFPYQGSTNMGYIDGSEGLNLNPPFEFGDYFFLNYSNGSGWVDFTTFPGTPGEVYGKSEISGVSLALSSGFTFLFQLQSLFPAGPPLAFSFVDPVPGDCSNTQCFDGLASFGSFALFSSIGVYTADGSQLTTTSYGGSLVIHQATLGPAAVPEPLSMGLIALDVTALGMARRQRSRRQKGRGVEVPSWWPPRRWRSVTVTDQRHARGRVTVVAPTAPEATRPEDAMVASARESSRLRGEEMRTSNQYDVIVVGARCAGSPTAMLLARKGHKVLLLDRATFPSDTISTHLLHPPGVAALKKWGLLDRLQSTGCPPIEVYAFDMGPFVLSGSPGSDESRVSYGPRRTVLDNLLVDAAAEAGVDVRSGFTVEEVLSEDGVVTGIRGHATGGPPVVERARVVVGADGLHSLVARTVAPEQYRERPQLQAGYYSYWSGLPMDSRFEAYDRGDRLWAAWPTNDDLTLVIVDWPYAEFEANKTDVERHYLQAFERAPAFEERIRAAKREERFFGAAVPNFFRKPFGPGWALVGDAGYNKDFITAQGITDAFRDAELCADAIDESFAGIRSFDAAMSAYQSARDEHVLPMYEFTCQFASFTPPTPEMQQLFGAMHGNQEAMDGFARVIAGVTSPATFFSGESVGRIFTAAR